MSSRKRRTPPGGLVSAGLDDMAMACRRATNAIDIATPFLTANVSAYLVRARDDGEARSRRLLTAMSTAAVEGGYLDPDAVEEFLAAGFEVRSLKKPARRGPHAAGLRPLHVHHLRHTSGSLLVAAGIDLATVQAAMGHSSITTTNRYLHARPAHEVADKFTAAFATGDARSAASAGVPD
jgi:hypothetical protein